VNILLTPIGSAGDNFPFIGLGDRLARRGHRVTVATGEHFAPLVRRYNLNYIQTGTEEEYRQTIANPDIWHPMKGFSMIMRYLGELARRLFGVVESFMNEHGGDAVVVAHSLDFGSLTLQEKFGLPVVTVHLSPALIRTVHQLPTLQGRANLSWMPRWAKRAMWGVINKLYTDKYAGPLVNELRAKLGLAPVRGFFDDRIHSPLLTLGMWPEWFAAPQPDYPPQVKLAGFPLFDGAEAQPVPGDVETFVAAGPPPIVFTPGSANAHASRFFDAALGACERVGRRALFLTKYTEHLPAALPGFAHHSPFAPLTLLLPRCAALVHHGGIGTTSAALAAGVPQLIMPLSHDQPDNAYRIKRLGAGDRLLPKHFKAKSVAKILRTLVESPEAKDRSAQLAGRLAREDGLGRSSALIEAAVPDRTVGHSQKVAEAFEHTAQSIRSAGV
jgi:UDP:flavonoid glycosyltransferase YjiC (YdhE family)